MCYRCMFLGRIQKKGQIVKPRIPLDVEARYEGRWIAWDTVTDEVVGDAETLEEAVEAATQAGRPSHLIWYHHVLPRDTVIVGGL